MVEGNDNNITNATPEELLVTLYNDLRKSQEQIEQLSKVNETLKQSANDGKKPDAELLKQLEELKVKADESSKLSEEYKKLQDVIKAKEDEIKKVNDSAQTKEAELRKLAELVNIQKANYDKTEERLKSIEQERQNELLYKKTQNLSKVVDQYVQLGLVDNTDDAKKAKLEGLLSMDDNAVAEISAMISNRLAIEPSRATQSSNELQLDDEIRNIGNDPEKSNKDKLAELFKRLNK